MRALIFFAGGVLALLCGLWLFVGQEPRAAALSSPAAGPTATPSRDRATLSLELPDELEVTPPEAPPPESGFRAHLFGRVVEVPGEHPLPDVPVAVRGPGDLRGGARTDAEGRFELEWEGPMEAEVRALPRRGYVALEDWDELTEAERRGEEEIVLRLRRGRSDVVRGRVLHGRTGMGVFALEAEVRGGGHAETCTTDGDGVFTTETAFPEGEVHVALADVAPEGTTSLGSFTRAHLEGGKLNPEWRLEVEIGPSYLVLSDVGELPSGCRVALREDLPPQRFSAVLRPEGGGRLVLAQERASRRMLRELGYDRSDTTREEDEPPEEAERWPWLLPREGDVAWIRYPHQIHEPTDGTFPRLVLDDPQGRWRSTADVPSTEGHHPQPIVLPLIPNSILEGRVRDTTSAPVAGALVQLLPLSRKDDTVLHHTTTDDGGSYELTGIDPGPYRMRVIPEVHAGDELEIRCNLGRCRAPLVALPPVIDVGDVAGTITVPADLHWGRPLVTLASSEGSRYRRVAPARGIGAPPGERAYSFRFEHVPSGRYEVSVGTASWREPAGADWTPRKRIVLPPNEAVDFRARTDGDMVDVRLSVTDERKRGVYQGGLGFGPGGMVAGRYDLRRTRRFVVPENAHFEWEVTSPGYRLARGDERDLVFDAEGATLDVELREGWSETVFLRGLPEAARDRDRAFEEGLFWPVPILGARAYVRGKLAGRSDRDGRLELDLGRAPREVGVFAPGWKGVVMRWERDGQGVLWMERVGE